MDPSSPPVPPPWGGRGSADLDRAAETLAGRLPEPLRPLARVAYNYRWSWTPGGPEVFRDIDPHRWHLCRENPVRMLQEASPAALERAASDPALVARLGLLSEVIERDLSRPPSSNGISPERPVAFLCSEYGVHRSLPIYSGGLGVLAGDILKEASDRALPFVAVGLFYRRGYFHQRVDVSGWQHEYWVDTDPERLPTVPVTDDTGLPLTVAVSLCGREVRAQIWRVQIGRIPLFLLDAELPGNLPVDRWITARLYDGNRTIRLAQYGLLGLGGIRALRALGIDPGLVHVNEGHGGLAALELAAEAVAAGASFPEACAGVRRRVVFTTHTPVPAGNETYAAEEILKVLGALPARLRTTEQTILGLGRFRPEELAEPSGLTALSMRLSRSVNGVSRRHGEVARAMWQPLFPGPVDAVPITHVTNGVHLPTWMSLPIHTLLDRHLGAGWREHAADPAVWAPVDGIPDEEIWAARCEARSHLVDFVRSRIVTDRLGRGDSLEYGEAAANGFDPAVLTVGFARRLASYKRLHLLVHDPSRALRLLEGPRPLQFVFGGKAHPQDDGAKKIVQGMFALKQAPQVAGRVAFLEDYDLSMSGLFVAGCDVWVNLPRPPQEASGTSGMKAALNGGLNLSVLDGWWAEAFDGANGWAIDGTVGLDDAELDARHAAAFYDLVESQVVPLFHDRDAAGVPHGWIARVKASLRTIGPMFCSARMLDDYVRRIYTEPGHST